MSDDPCLNIAVIGSGAAGLTAAHLLQKKHRVTLLEKDGRLGGHTSTVMIPDGPDAGTPVDTGFIVMNHRNYPLLTRLFEQLGVQLRDSTMSFGYHDLPSGLQYCGSGLDGLFAQHAVTRVRQELLVIDPEVCSQLEVGHQISQVWQRDRRPTLTDVGRRLRRNPQSPGQIPLLEAPLLQQGNDLLVDEDHGCVG